MIIEFFDNDGEKAIEGHLEDGNIIDLFESPVTPTSMESRGGWRLTGTSFTLMAWCVKVFFTSLSPRYRTPGVRSPIEADPNGR